MSKDMDGKTRVGLFSLRNKLVLFAMGLALIPLVVAGRRLIQITRDELKSSANEAILRVAEQVSGDMDATYRDIWLAPLRLIAGSLNTRRLDPSSIRNLLQTGVAEIPGVVACQIRVEGLAQPLMVTRDDFMAKLTAANLAPISVLNVDETLVSAARKPVSGKQRRVGETGEWLLPIVIPLPDLIPEKNAWLVAHVDLSRLIGLVMNHPFNENGRIRLVDRSGASVFDEEEVETGLSIVAEAVAMLDGNNRGVQIKPYTDGSGTHYLAGFTAPIYFHWALILEQDEAVAYRALTLMDRVLGRLAGFGVAIALVGALVFAFRISGPVEEMVRVAGKVGEGDLDIVVKPSRGRDEIALLGNRMNQMIAGLRERDFIRDTFGRYVSPEVAASVLADPGALQPGGELRTVTILMSDLRGFTSMSEQLTPAVMVDVLNMHLGDMSEIVAAHGGTVIEFIGDAIMALFGAPIKGEDDPLRALACAATMQIDVERFNRAHPEIPPLRMGIGINTGKVIVGNIGSEKRMKYGVVGDDVNLAARVESFTTGGEVMVSETTRAAVGELAGFRGPILVSAKGKKDRLSIFALVSVAGRFNLEVPCERREQTTFLPLRIDARFQRIDGKQISDDVLSGTLTGLVGEDAELHTIEHLEIFDNIKLVLLQGPGSETTITDLYAKVVRVRKENGETVARLTLTSIPEHHRDTLKQIEATASTHVTRTDSS